ncbi:hypothetical protein BE21_03780 [Sorangium cellulosum]|uniref:Uncharacterized protein n=1 Tax=Sorangium cellulosum TaxID=56 RepID=A0A150TJA4_SORCE|nr:hypothetical protein BE21_03780 [Sorangium cellulosum]
MVFPASEEAPETNRHLELRTALYLILKRELAQGATLGSNQFVYWDPTTSRKRLAPDAFVRLGVPHRTLGLWWTVVEDPSIGPMLRLSRDREGRDLLPTPDEAEAKAREARTREAEARTREAEAQAREAEAQAREANKTLEAEVAALRVQLAEAKGKRRPRRRSPG